MPVWHWVVKGCPLYVTDQTTSSQKGWKGQRGKFECCGFVKISPSTPEAKYSDSQLLSLGVYLFLNKVHYSGSEMEPMALVGTHFRLPPHDWQLKVKQKQKQADDRCESASLRLKEQEVKVQRCCTGRELQTGLFVGFSHVCCCISYSV